MSVDEALVLQCETDYAIAEITALAHLAPDASEPTHVLAVVELLHEHLEANPLVELAPDEGGYPRRVDLGRRAGKLFVQRWRLPVRDGLAWYRACANGSMTVPAVGQAKPSLVSLGELGDDPPWPRLVVELDPFWSHHEFWGHRPGGSRWHRLLPLEPVDITHGWEPTDFEKARDFFTAEIHVDLLSRSVLLGSCHLCLPNPVYRRLGQRVNDDWRSLTFDLEPYPGQAPELELTVWNQRAWGATSVLRASLQPGLNAVPVPEGVEQIAHAVTCKHRGLLEQSESTAFIAAAEISMNVVAEERRVETPKGTYSVGVSGPPEQIVVGTPRPKDALARMGADEGQQRTQRAWEKTAFRWFDGDRVGGAQAIRDIIRSASQGVDLLDPYFGRADLLEFALATSRHRLPFRALTSHDYLTSGKDEALQVEYGDALARTIESVRGQDPRLNIELRVMPGQKSPVHDRFLIVDGTVWVLGASLNEFGNRGSLLMKLPASPAAGAAGAPGFSVSKDVFAAQWEAATDLMTWVTRRAAAREQGKPRSVRARLVSTKDTLKKALRQVRETWHA